MFWARSKAKPNAKTVKVSRLSIYKSTGGKLTLEHEPWTGADIVKPWRAFLGWYFSRDSKAYWFKTQTGGAMILRSTILEFEIRVVNKEVPTE